VEGVHAGVSTDTWDAAFYAVFVCLEQEGYAMQPHIEAVSVNHNTSLYMELMLRSLAAHHGPELGLAVTVADNASTDDTTRLAAYTRRLGIPLVPSGFTTASPHNSHGEVLSQFVLAHPACTHYLFLDADVCFLEDNTLQTMLDELNGTEAAFGIGARMSWDGVTEVPEEVRRSNPDIYEARLHPCCALIKNTALFRQVVQTIGLSPVRYVWAEGEEYLDTCKLMTRVMATHGLRHILSTRMVLHFFGVTYDFEHHREERDRRRDTLLAALRGTEAS
jgi:hypothetical protein